MAELVRLDETSGGREVSVEVGATLEVTLEENRTTGFRWKVVETGEPQLGSMTVSSKPDLSRAGAPGKRTWRWLAACTGLATIRLRYERSWERDSTQAREFVLRVLVSAPQ
jgi:inhibitor of cysteine peptidase